MTGFGGANPFLCFLRAHKDGQDATDQKQQRGRSHQKQEQKQAEGKRIPTTQDLRLPDLTEEHITQLTLSESPAEEKGDPLGAVDEEEELDHIIDKDDFHLHDDTSPQDIFLGTKRRSEDGEDTASAAASPDKPTDDDAATLHERGEDIVKELQKEFGPIEFAGPTPECAVDHGAERYIADIPASLASGVLVRGLAFLTNRRLAFYATLPPEEQEIESKTDGTNTTERLTGTGTIHFESSFKPKKRVFLVLRNDSIVVYSSPQHLDQPWGLAHFSNITKVEPVLDDKGSKWLDFKFVQRIDRRPQEIKAHCQFDDEIAASRWRNALSAAVFQYQNQHDRFRASIPLDRVEKVETVSWADFATTNIMTIIAEGEERKTFPLAVLQKYAAFLDQLSNAISDVRSRCSSAGTAPISSLPIIEIYAPTVDSQEFRSPTENRTSDEVYTCLGASGEDREYKPTPRQLERFRYEFGLFGDNEDIYFTTVGSLSRAIPVFGKLALSQKGIMFSRKTAMVNRVKIFIPVADVKEASATKTFFMNSFGLRIQIRGQEDLALLFPTSHRRDAVLKAIQSLTGCTARVGQKSKNTSTLEEAPATSPKETRSNLGEWSSSVPGPPPLEDVPPELVAHLPPMAGSENRKLYPTSKTFGCLTIGSRGDVQPYIALCKGLIAEGHKAIIFTHAEYSDWIASHGIGHRAVGGDAGLLMEISVEHKIFDQETQKQFSKWFINLLHEAYHEIKGANVDVLIESPSAFAGIHVSEALKLPYIRAFSMPWTRTGDFPHAFINGPQNLSRAYNYSTYVLFDNVMWRASSGMINTWRVKDLGLDKTTLDQMRQSEVPTLYFFSEALVPRPLDWPSWVQITGSWVLPNSDGDDWTPPKDLEEFIRKAREDGKPLVYCGFGSITVNDPNAMTNAVIESVHMAGVRLILSKGWSSRMQGSKSGAEPEIPQDVHLIDSVPHDWLFPRMDAVMHHGGAGTTASSLSAGVPTLIRPFFGDQYFWANRVNNLGAGLRVKSLSGEDMAAAWKEATGSTLMKERAELVAAKLKQDDGVSKAIRLIYAYLPISTREGNSARKSSTPDKPRRRSSSVLVPSPVAASPNSP